MCIRDSPYAGEVLLGFDERPVGHQCLLTPVVDDRGRLGVGEPAREHPVTVGDQTFVELADRGPPVGAARIVLVVDDGNQN